MNKKVFIVCCILFVITAFIFLIPVCIMWLYNSWLGGLFGIASLTYGQAFALWVLCSILFKSVPYTDEDLKKKIYKFLDEISDEFSEETIQSETNTESENTEQKG